jgi:hypothetical protein
MHSSISNFPFTNLFSFATTYRTFISKRLCKLMQKKKVTLRKHVKIDNERRRVGTITEE